MNVNFGLLQDYKELAERNVDVRGKIVMARLDTGWRGEKVFHSVSTLVPVVIRFFKI